MNKLERFLLKLAYAKGISSQGKWTVVQTLLNMQREELLCSEIVEIAKNYRYQKLFQESWCQLHKKGSELETAQSFLTCVDSRYPPQLLHLAYPPILLFYTGDLSLLKKKMISVVGGRKTSVLAKKVVHHLLFPIIEAGYVIVSGCAKGIDTYAHQATINYSGKTIAVIGTGIKQVYPKENQLLQEEIGKKHLLLSEYPPDQGPRRTQFPMRNRIIAALSQGTCVIEAKKKSGSLITAQQALEIGRTVFSVPGNILTQHSIGSHQLIQDGAVCVISGQDLLAELKE
ncbi:DNA-processing protein DprA [Enterococcus ratti]|uniref:DNA protecting protein DprA n=1 Tax=Enterococcus ratti TaxID=150033 RepID=A0A1L8WLE0_9ENTE|nr:DNA-processing protein DprA [Enterococcus ratti]OJG81838.1 DNA protecting protein DprA [Enterococcus ratti]